MKKNIAKFLGVSLIVLSVSACSSFSGLKSAKGSEAGFGNISDVAIPKAAKMDLEKSVVLGDGPTWTGHLVYTIDKPQAEVIDFINNKTKELGWTRVSELRAKETITTFMKDKRFVIVRVSGQDGFMSKKTTVSVEMTSSDLALKNIISSDEKSGSCGSDDCDANDDRD